MAARKDITAGLRKALVRNGLGKICEVSGLTRLTGGAMMESWRFEADGKTYVLRRAPSLAFMEGRTFGHDVEAAIVQAAHDAGVKAPKVLLVLEESDGLGSGFVMEALPGTPDPRAILDMETPGLLLEDAARDLARIHSLGSQDVPASVPRMNYAEAVAGLAEQFETAGGDRPIVALGLKWLADNLPAPVDPVLCHGDFRLGNILADRGRLSGVLDWEIAHFGDRHEDLAFACLPVWRFGRVDRPAMGLGSLDAFFAAYEAESGARIDRQRFGFWMIYRTVWWALGCLRQGHVWRSGEDRMVERVVISRRASEQEVDLLLLLEEHASREERQRPLPDPGPARRAPEGESSAGEIATAVGEWLATLKDKVEGHDRFQLAVARNALGIVAREERSRPDPHDRALSQEILAGRKGLATAGLLASLKRQALDTLASDIPKYPMLAVASEKWGDVSRQGEN